MERFHPYKLGKTIIKKETSHIQYEMFRKSFVPLFGVPNKKEIRLEILFFMFFYRIKEDASPKESETKVITSGRADCQ